MREHSLHSPRIDHIEVVRKGKVRRAKLYYLRDRVGKAAKVKEKHKQIITKYMGLATVPYYFINGTKRPHDTWNIFPGGACITGRSGIV